MSRILNEVGKKKKVTERLSLVNILRLGRAVTTMEGSTHLCNECIQGDVLCVLNTSTL